METSPYFGGVTLDWQAKVAATIVAAEKALPNRHLIAQNIANNQAKIKDPDPAVSIFNFHYARPPGTVALNYALGRPIGDDETGFDGVGDFAYRSEAWDFLLAGGAIFSHLDYSFTTDHEDGTAEVKPPTPGGGGPRFRGQLAYLKRFVEGFDFARMRPDQSVVRGPMPAGMTARVLAGRGKAYAIYLKGTTKAGTRLGLDLPPGSYRWERHDPASGKVEDEGRIVVEDGETASIALGPIAEDVAIKVVAGP